MREEHVDGGFLVTLGTYTGTEDFSKPVVRQLQVQKSVDLREFGRRADCISRIRSSANSHPSGGG